MGYLKDFEFNVSKEFLDSVFTIKETIKSLEDQLKEVNILQERIATIIEALSSSCRNDGVSVTLKDENIDYFKSNKNFKIKKYQAIDGMYYHIIFKK